MTVAVSLTGTPPTVLVSVLVIVSAILRPWTYRRNWGRALGALALLVPWTGLSIVMTMHAGGIVALHALWLMLVAVIVFVALLSAIFVRD